MNTPAPKFTDSELCFISHCLETAKQVFKDDAELLERQHGTAEENIRAANRFRTQMRQADTLINRINEYV